MTKKVIFISYSHDSDAHKMWVKKFAEDLERLGEFEILLDQNLPKGYPLTRFMEQGLMNADKVLVIGTPQYKQKSEVGKGVAFEGTIISTELMQDIDTCKYYPILRSGTFETSFPVSLQGRGGDDIRDDSKYTDKLHEIAYSISDEKPVPTALTFRKQTDVQNTIESKLFTKSELNEMLDNAEINLPIVKGKIEKIKKELPYLASGETCIMTRLRIEGAMYGLSELIQQIKTCICETDNRSFAEEIANNVFPIWNECAEYAKQNTWFPWNADAQAINKEIDSIVRWMNRNKRNL